MTQPAVPTGCAKTRRLRDYPETVTLASGMYLGLVVILALGIGAVWINPLTVIDILLDSLGVPGTGSLASDIERSILLNVRMPRVIVSLMSGAVLALTGVLMQAFFRNPLADPALIGVSAGGALGAVTIIVLGASLFSGFTRLGAAFALPFAAFIGSLSACASVFALARQGGHVNVTTMLLCGIAVNAMAGAGIGLLSFLADDAQLRDLTFWTLGSLSAASWWKAFTLAPVLIALTISVPFLVGGLNALLLGDSEALHLGYHVERLKLIILLLTCVGAGAVVATCGLIAFVGLIGPHVSRLLVGPNHKYVLPLSAVIGAALLTLADIVARTSVAPAELPIGVLTAMIGGPIFLWLLRRKQGAAFDA